MPAQAIDGQGLTMSSLTLSVPYQNQGTRVKLEQELNYSAQYCTVSIPVSDPRLRRGREAVTACWCRTVEAPDLDSRGCTVTAFVSFLRKACSRLSGFRTRGSRPRVEQGDVQV